MTHARSEYKDFMALTPDAYAAVLAPVRSPPRPAWTSTARTSSLNRKSMAALVQYHIMESEKLGVPTDKINLVVVWREAPQFSPRERADWPGRRR